MAGETTHATAAATHGADAAGQAAQAAGMPQLDFSSWPNQIFWLLVTLVVIYLVLKRVALPRIESVLAERQGTITSDIAKAEELKQKAKEAEAAYEKALADAHAEAAEIVARTKADMKAELDAATAKAEAEIAERTAEGEKAIAAIRAEAADTARQVALDVAREIVTHLGFKAEGDALAKAVETRVKG